MSGHVHWASLALIVSVLGCSDDDPKPSPRNQCVKIAEATCELVTSCLEYHEQFSTLSQARKFNEDCQADGPDIFECDDVASVSSRYRECLSDLADGVDDGLCVISFSNGKVSYTPETPKSCRGVLMN